MPFYFCVGNFIRRRDVFVYFCVGNFIRRRDVFVVPSGDKRRACLRCFSFHFGTTIVTSLPQPLPQSEQQPTTTSSYLVVSAASDAKNTRPTIPPTYQLGSFRPYFQYTIYFQHT